MSTLKFLATLAIMPGLLAGQHHNPVDQLRTVLPARVADKVIAIVTDATSHGLPGQAIAERALEATAKGRSGDEVSAAAQALAADLGAARDVLDGAGRTPAASEIEAGATAQELGVNRGAIRTLATAAPAGRSLTVPLAVIGALVNRGLPSDAAVQAVLERLKARATDTDLAAMPDEASRLTAQGYKPSDVGRVLSAVSRPEAVPGNGGHPGPRPTRPTAP